MKTYSVNEIFYSIQGEGFHAGRASSFVRFSGCNVWSGREEDRGPSCSAWCDTDFLRGRRYTLSKLVGSVPQAEWVILTGGEPALQADGQLVSLLKKERGFRVAMETNGTRPLPPGLDWVTVSPKERTALRVVSGNELKLVYPQQGVDPGRFEHLDFDHFFLQPLDGEDGSDKAALDYCLRNPKWRLSLQIHKALGAR